MSTTLVKSPNAATAVAEEETKTVEAIIDASKATRYAAYVTVGKLEVGLRRRTFLEHRCFQQFIRTCYAAKLLEELMAEFGYAFELLDDELTDYLWHSSQVVKAVGVDYVAYGDSAETIKRKFVAYISTPDVERLWGEVNKALNTLDRNPDPITAPKVVTTDPKS